MTQKIFLYKVVRGDKVVPGGNELLHEEAQKLAARLNQEALQKNGIPKDQVCIYFVMGDKWIKQAK